MKIIKLFIITLVITISTNQIIFAQNASDSWSINADFGSLLFYGDIKQFDYIPILKNRNELRWGTSIAINKRINYYIEFKFQLLQGELSGTKRKANRYFDATIFEYSFNGIINLNDLIFANKMTRISDNMTVYAIAGAGVVRFRSIQRKLSDNSIVKCIGYKDNGKTKKKMTAELVIPFGIGVEYKLNDLLGRYNNEFINKLNINFEATYRSAKTDKLDAEVNLGDDQYSYISLGLTYHFSE